MITEELKTLVLTEAKNLLIHATKEERQRLDITKLKPASAVLCVYGLMTGNCSSDRAFQLVQSCGKPYSAYCNCYQPRDSFFEFGQSPHARNFTALEFYICQEGAKNAELIAYLKGETDTLEL